MKKLGRFLGMSILLLSVLVSLLVMIPLLLVLDVIDFIKNGFKVKKYG